MCGADLLHSMTVPGVWIEEQVRALLHDYIIVAFPRVGYERHALMENEAMASNRDHIIFVDEPLLNNVSSTLIRDEIKRKRSVRFLTPDAVIRYIKSKGLYT